MSRPVLRALFIVALTAGAGCAARSTSHPHAMVAEPGYALMHPPDVPDTHYPGGVHVVSEAPMDSWHRDAVFATREECELSRITRIDDSIDDARAEVGDQAKFQLPVRRAVNARCVLAR
jgi:hypothetical protein